MEQIDTEAVAVNLFHDLAGLVRYCAISIDNSQSLHQQGQRQTHGVRCYAVTDQHQIDKN